MNMSTTAVLAAMSLVLAQGALAQTAAQPTATPPAATDTTAPAAPATPPVRGAGAVPAEGATSVEVKTNAAGSAVATGMGEVTPGQMVGTTIQLPEGPMDLTPDHMENGRWYNAEGIPTFKIDENGELDYASFSGYRRYHAECHVCHGPDGEGSTYAPALKDSVINKLDYYAFQQIVASGMQNVGAGQANQVMPAFGTNKNVWCYVDDIYVYLLAHGTGAIPRGRPANKAQKSDEFTAQESACMDG